MEKKQKTIEKSIVRRISKNEDQYILKCGSGDFKSGLCQIIGWHKRLVQDPKQILFADIDLLTTHAKELMSENHYEHFVECGVPALLVGWAKTGFVNPRFLKAPNKALGDFDKSEGEKDGK